MSLEQRVAELERRTVRYRNALVLLVVGVCAIAVVGATTDNDVISGRALFLMNDQGEVVIRAGANTDGDGLLKVMSKLGTDLIYAGASVDDTGFSLKATTRSVREWFSYLPTTTATAWSVPTIAPNTSRLSSLYPSFDVTADGQRFVVVENWVKEFQDQK